MPAWIRRKQGASGARYVVIYRVGGRSFPQRHAGSFTREREARLRRDFVAGELAAGRDPAAALRALRNPPPRRSPREWGEAWLATRVDLAASTIQAYRPALASVYSFVEERRVELDGLTVRDVQEWVGEHAELAPATVEAYLATFRQLLDFAGVDPNPTRDRTLRLPAVERDEVEPPAAAQVVAMLRYVPRAIALPLAAIEQTAMRVSEPEALEWRDVDVEGSRFRIRAETVKGRRGRRRSRWVQLPAWLMELVAASCPPDDRVPGRLVFLGFTDRGARHAMERACKAAGIAHYHPHDLRHRRLSLWHGQGVTPAEAAKRAGQTRIATTLDVYTHVMPLDEIPVETYLELLAPPALTAAIVRSSA